MAFRNEVLSGPHPGWEKGVRARLDAAAHAWRFENLTQADLAGADFIVRSLPSLSAPLEGRGPALAERLGEAQFADPRMESTH